jgi:hypothetical protein
MSATLQTPCELPSVMCRQRLLAKRRAAWRGAAMRDLDRRRRMGYGSASGVSGRQGLGGAAGKAANLVGCKSPHRQLPDSDG